MRVNILFLNILHLSCKGTHINEKKKQDGRENDSCIFLTPTSLPHDKSQIGVAESLRQNVHIDT